MSVDHFVRQAERFVAKGKLEPAARLYERALRQNPDDLGTANRLGDLHARLGEVEQAVDHFQRIALQYARDGFFVKAIAMHKKILRIDPSRAASHESLGDLYRRQGLPKDACRHFENAAELHEAAGRFSEAVAARERRAETDPADPGARLDLAALLERTGDPKGAARERRVAEDLVRLTKPIEPVDRDEAVAAAERFVGRGKITAAIKLYRRILDHYPNDWSSVSRIADLHARLEQTEEAAQAMQSLAEHHAEEGFWVKAIAIYKKIQKIDPKPVWSLRLAELYRLSGLTSEALEQYRSLAEAFEDLEDWSSAIGVYHKLVELSPKNPQWRRKLVELLQQTGRREEAEDHLRYLESLEKPSDYQTFDFDWFFDDTEPASLVHPPADLVDIAPAEVFATEEAHESEEAQDDDPVEFTLDLPEEDDDLELLDRLEDFTDSRQADENGPRTETSPSSAGPTEPAAGDTVGRFRLESILGKGPESTLWAATDTVLEGVTPYAIQSFPASSAGKAGTWRRFFTFSHPDALEIRDVLAGSHGVDDFLVLERPPGKDLGAVMLEGELSREERLRVVLDTARILEAAHKQGLVHGAFGPTCIWVGAEGRPKFCAPPLDAHDDFRAPETRGPDPAADPRSDVFSLARIASFLLADDGSADLTSAPEREPLDPLEISDTTRSVLARGTAKDPSRRYATVSELARALEESLLDSPEASSEVSAWEAKARELIHADDFSSAVDLLRRAVARDPSGKRRLATELGFLRDLGFPIDGPKTVPSRQARLRGLWWKRLWALTAFDNAFPPAAPGLAEAGAPAETEDDPSTPAESTGLTPNRASRENQPSLPSRQKGDVLERGVVEVFRTLFQVGEEEEQTILRELRRQSAGSQHGSDLRLSFERPLPTRANRNVRCRVECKDLSRDITVDQIGGKLLLTAETAMGADIDHWILITPHTKPSNDLRELLDSFELRGRFPFSVQIWGPDEQVAELFGLVPEVYAHYWPDDPLGLQPGSWSEARRLRVKETWLEKIRPHLRIARCWKTYLREPHRLRMPYEPPNTEMEDVYEHHISVSCTDRAGRSGGPVQQQLERWLHAQENPVLFVLGEFGDGKTYMSYLLGRRQHEQFLEDPTRGSVVVRFPLRDYQAGGDPQTFLEARLRQLGATLDEWTELCRRHRVLAVLDGFDEMSVPLDRESVTASIVQLEECVKRLQTLNPETSLKVLVTSRPHFFVNARDEQRLFSRLEDPPVLRLAPVSFGSVWENLQSFAQGGDERRELRLLSELNDPIGLAAKPLYLQMVKTTLRFEARDGENDAVGKALDGVSLYDRYVRNVLKRKWELLDDAEKRTLPKEVVAGLLHILERVALAQQTSGAHYVLLRDFFKDSDESLAKLLWPSAYDDATPGEQQEDDAVARVGVRSLLSPVLTDDPELRARWPVDFSHRSMREYFVARALGRGLERDPDSVKDLLASPRMSREVLDFTAVLLKRRWSPTVAQSLRAMIEQRGEQAAESRLGGNAAGLIYSATGELPGEDWSGLHLDYADFADASLSGKSFRGSSLRHARLDNATLEGTDLRECDLTGVVLEQTSPVRAVLPGPREVDVVYADGSVRSWSMQQDRDAYRESPLELGVPVRGLGTGPSETVWAAVGEEIVVVTLSPREDQKIHGRFRVRPESLGLSVEGDEILIVEKHGESSWGARVVDLERYALTRELLLEEEPLCWAFDGRLIVVANEENVRFISARDDRFDSSLPFPSISSLAAVEVDSFRSLVAVGDRTGNARILQVDLGEEDWQITTILEESLHEGAVSCVELFGAGTLVTGGMDRAVCMIDFHQETQGARVLRRRRFHRTIRCAGVKTDGLIPQELRETLQSLQLPPCEE